MYKSIYLKKTAIIISLICGFLFTVFTVAYLFKFQSELLSTAQHALSNGLTEYSPFWGTLIITVLLLILKWGVSSIISLPIRFRALYYFPSALLLGILTSMTSDGGWNISFDFNLIHIVIYIVLFLLMLWIVMHYPDAREDKFGMFHYLWTNLLILGVICCISASIGNCNDVYHYKFKAEKYIQEGNYEKALEVGVKSLKSDRTLTAMRVFALSKEEKLPDHLFRYPQYYGSEGLLPKDSIFSTEWLISLYRHLGAKPGKNISSTTQFLEILSKREYATKAVGDYLLCSYLLDKNLDKFENRIGDYYQINDSIPYYYKEALILYSRLHTNPKIVYHNAEVEENLNDFIKLESEYKDNYTARSNRTRLMYGQTYWWYYYYQKRDE